MTSPAASASRIPVYLDCDTGIDDSLALAYLLASDDCEIVGIGTVSGNTDAQQAAENTLGLLSLAGRTGIPVAVGSRDYFSHPFFGGAPHVHGETGFGEVELPVDDELRPIAVDAADLLARLALEHAGELRVVAIGPLTNLAVALERHPELPSLVHSVTVMGGAAMAPGNVTPVAEANIWHDPEAAALVVEAGWHITLVPLDVTMTERLTEAHRDELEASGQPLAVAIAGALHFYFDFYVEHFGVRSAALHDPLAAAVALGHVEPVLAPATTVVVDTSHGPGRGQTICDLRGVYQDYAAVVAAPAELISTVLLRTDGGFGDRLVARILGR